MDAGRWCDAYHLRSEGTGRQIDQIGPLGKAGGPPGSPMDRDDTIWASAADRFCRLLGVEMTRTERGMLRYARIPDFGPPVLQRVRVWPVIAD